MAKMAGMSELSEMSKDYIRATRHATICSVSEMSKMAKMARMSELSEMSKDYIRATRHATICPVSEMSEKAEKAEMSNVTTRHVMCSLGEVAV